MSKLHDFNTTVIWSNDSGTGTTDYSAYSRNHTILSANKPPILGSSDPVFKGDAAKYNPEQLLIASASACHMLWYLHLCADSGVVVVNYKDMATGALLVEANGSGKFKEITLNPEVTVTEAGMREKAIALHEKAGQMCFIANSCNFPIKHKATVHLGAAKQ